jgi:glutamyl-tRNA reductase
MRLVLIGINHDTAPVALREQLCLGEQDSERVLRAIAQRADVQEALLLCTCNRTELLVQYPPAVANVAALPSQLVAELGRLQHLPALAEASFYVHHDLAAVRHSFRVAAGLDSMILGETQILGQLKQAYRLACRVGTTGFLLNKLLHAAFRVGKRVRTGTGIGLGTASVSQAAVGLLSAVVPRLAKQRILLLGAGEMARLVAQGLVKRRCRHLQLCNRTDARALALARRLGVDAVPFAARAAAIRRARVVVLATAAPVPLLSDQEFPGPVMVLDLGVPRNAAPELAQRPQVTLRNIDDLRQAADASLARRRADLPRAEALVEEGVEHFSQWHRTLAVTPTIVELLAKFERLRQQELARGAKGLTPEQRRQLDRITFRLLQKVLHAPLVHLRRGVHGDVDNAASRVNAVRTVFDLKGTPDA